MLKTGWLCEIVGLFGHIFDGSLQFVLQ